MKRLLAFLLALLVCGASLASCAETKEDPAATGPESGGSDAPIPADSEVEELLEIPDTRYDGAELTFLTRDEAEWTTSEIFVEKLDAKSDNITTAVYDRNCLMQDRYGVKILEFRQETGKHPATVSNEVHAPTGDFSAIITNTYNSGQFSSQGYLWDLKSEDIRYIDLSKSWWDGNLAENCSVNHRLHFATGDLLTSDNDATFVILFNKNLAKDCQLPDLYQAVSDNQWTMDKLYAFEQTAVSDVKGDTKLDYKEDVCGLAYTDDSPSCLLYAGGITLTGKDEDDMPIWRLDVERTEDIAEKCKLIFSKDFTVRINEFVYSGEGSMYEVGRTCFGEGHALFMSECMQCVTRMRGCDVDFGILPYPMYDERQDGYHSMMHYTGSSVSIPRSVSENSRNTLEMVDSMIEAMAYLSKGTLTIQYYEINLKTKDSKDPESGPMIDNILSHRIFDLAYYYQWGNAVTSLAACFLPNTTTSVSSTAKKAERACDSAIRRFVRSVERAQKKG